MKERADASIRKKTEVNKRLDDVAGFPLSSTKPSTVYHGFHGSESNVPPPLPSSSGLSQQPSRLLLLRGKWCQWITSRHSGGNPRGCTQPEPCLYDVRDCVCVRHQPTLLWNRQRVLWYWAPVCLPTLLSDYILHSNCYTYCYADNIVRVCVCVCTSQNWLIKASDFLLLCQNDIPAASSLLQSMIEVFVVMF